MNVIFLGYRGSGKTTIGRKVADQTWKDFADTDAEVRKRFGNRSIAEIWDTEGEPAFRAAEVEVTRQLLGRDNLVVALGGGTLMQDGSRQAVIDAPDAKRIYLAASAEVLARRIADDAATGRTRPALTGLGGGPEEVAAVLAERDPVYRQVADVVFDVNHVDVAGAVAYLTRHHL
ncbi:MAG: shikimate kinase [Planctomycetota bacterium]